MQVSKWGNSLAIRLPAAIVEVMGLKVGDDVEVTFARDGKIELERQDALDEAILARFRALRSRLPVGFKFDREEANRRGE